MKTIIVSALTSLLVSLMTFILGLKSGKNQTDRARLQDLYKQLHTHFKEIKNGFITHRYKKWSDYKRIESINRIQYLPLVKELDRTGDLIYIHKGIANKAITLEQKCLNYEHEIEKEIERLHQFIIEPADSLFEGGIDGKYNTSNH